MLWLLFEGRILGYDTAEPLGSTLKILLLCVSFVQKASVSILGSLSVIKTNIRAVINQQYYHFSESRFVKIEIITALF